MTTPRRLRVSAPGKLMIAGEYAVLWGHRAVVAAVSRRVVVRVSPPGDAGSPPPPAGSRERAPVPPEVRVARTRAEARTGQLLWGEPMADVTALLDVSGVKLGLGSSSANAVATAAAVFAAAGADIASPDVRAQIMASALEGHRAVAPHGSGADVAASTFGGVLSFVTQTGVSGAPEIDLEEVNLPPGFHARVVWTGQAVRTSEFVAAVRALSSAHPEVHAAQVDAIGDASERMVTAMASAKAGDFIAAVADHHVAMEALGLAASVPIVEERLARVAALAAAHGGAAKPSGAGGGDVAMGFFASAQQADAFASAAAAEGLAPVALGLGADGVREEDVEP